MSSNPGNIGTEPKAPEAAGNRLTKVEVSIESLHPGWIVDRDIWSGAERLLSAGVEITPGIIKRLKDRGIKHITVHADSELACSEDRLPDSDHLTRLLETAGAIYDKHGLQTAIPQEFLDNATTQVEGFFHEIEKGEPFEPETARNMVHTLVELFTSRSNLAVKLLDLDKVDHYTYRHSLNVGMLFMAIASDWVDSQDELEELVFGVVLHDLGKAKVGSDIINKPGKLSDDEWVIMRKHPIWSAELLAEVDASSDAMSIARSHHERLDGKGYPDGLTAEKITQWSKLSSVCDVYDALTTKRSYKRKMDFAKAIDIVVQDCGKAFDSNIANAFIRKIGRYPAGSFVWLSSGEAAIVIEINESAVSRPIVSRVLNVDKTAREEAERLDLREHPEIHITGLVGDLEDR